MSIETMKLALEFVEDVYAGEWHGPILRREQVSEALRQAIEQAQEPVGRFSKFTDGVWKEVTATSAGQPLYATPPQRQPLTENEIKHLWYEACQTNLELTSQLIVHLARAIEAAHSIGEQK